MCVFTLVLKIFSPLVVALFNDAVCANMFDLLTFNHHAVGNPYGLKVKDVRVAWIAGKQFMWTYFNTSQNSNGLVI